MSSRRSRSRQSGTSRITEEQISDLVSKLQDLLPEARLQGNATVCTIGEGVAGDVQLHQELAPGGGRPEREAVGAAGDIRHEQRAGGDHPQPAHVERDLGTLGAFIA
ncbi:hypothetical protein BAE44_0010713 [Dichanthelium oligosanthes]|uniref:Uncharacterized protein n=1 Tax=Dichanthelium oligosanthes TaxID=888268 RepID=A0A1E5VT09_9POAL|nr:hypothetical protein BAE44_0010713 [Dichanthelium oligosanthes]